VTGPNRAPAAGLAGTLVAALGGGGLFLALWLALGIPLPWSAAAGGAGYGAIWFMLKGARRREERIPFAGDFVDKELARKTISRARQAAGKLREESARMEKGDALAPRLDRLAKLQEAIASDVEADPKDALSASAFLSTQGEAASRIARLAVDLAGRGASDAQLGQAREKIAFALDRLVSLHERHLANLQEDNLAELQAELDAIEEGLSLEEEIDGASRRNGASDPV
jgi:hypothetical protein